MKMQNAEMKFVSFDTCDVITASTPAVDPYVSFANFGNRQSSDNTITISGTPYDVKPLDGYQFAEALNSAFQTSNINAYTGYWGGVSPEVVAEVCENDYLDTESKSDLNGTWKWITDHFVKQ
ncbi:MAG: hypothetical protein Q4E35_03360 [Eubacteriales bacterium]|nr:hypothetical protein [Eubacteriales bacterium]